MYGQTEFAHETNLGNFLHVPTVGVQWGEVFVVCLGFYQEMIAERVTVLTCINFPDMSPVKCRVGVANLVVPATNSG